MAGSVGFMVNLSPGPLERFSPGIVAQANLDVAVGLPNLEAHRDPSLVYLRSTTWCLGHRRGASEPLVSPRAGRVQALSPVCPSGTARARPRGLSRQRGRTVNNWSTMTTNRHWQSRLANAPHPATLNASQEGLAQQMRAAWTAFARNDNPSTSSVPWPTFNTGSKVLSHHSPQPTVDGGFDADHRSGFWGVS